MISFFPEVTYDWSEWKLLHECSQYTHYIELTPTLRANVNHFHVSKAVRKYQLHVFHVMIYFGYATYVLLIHSFSGGKN